MSSTQGQAAIGLDGGFPSPLAVTLPAECEGWEELYPPHALFAADRGGFDESRFWFQDAVHYSEPQYPFDVVSLDSIVAGLSQASARLFAVRPRSASRSASSAATSSSAPTPSRTRQRSRSGPNCSQRAAATTTSTGTSSIGSGARFGRRSESSRRWGSDLPDVEDAALVTEGRGVGSAHALLRAYDRLLESFDLMGHYHFELLNLGYGAYLALYDRCRHAFPDISDQTVAKMVTGNELVALRPDDELRTLAKRAVELGIAGEVRTAHCEQDLISALAKNDVGDRWLTEYTQAKDPWFCFSYGNGLYHHHRSWIDDPKLPIAMIGSTPNGYRPGKTSPAPERRCLPSAIASPTNTATCSPDKHATRSTSSSRSHAPCSRTSRITTSTSTTGPTRCCGTRCASSARY